MKNQPKECSASTLIYEISIHPASMRLQCQLDILVGQEVVGRATACSTHNFLCSETRLTGATTTFSKHNEVPQWSTCRYQEKFCALPLAPAQTCALAYTHVSSLPSPYSHTHTGPWPIRVPYSLLPLTEPAHRRLHHTPLSRHPHLLPVHWTCPHEQGTKTSVAKRGVPWWKCHENWL